MNYFQVHKNKKPKKAKYSKLYSKLEIVKMNKCTDYFMKQIEILKQKIIRL